MTSEGNGKASSSGTGSPLVAKDGEIPEKDESPISEQEESLEQHVSETASAANALSSDAAQIIPSLQNLLLNNDIQRERLIGLVQLYDSTTQDTNANVSTTESEQSAREADLSAQIHFLEQSMQKLEEVLENLKKLNAQVL